MSKALYGHLGGHDPRLLSELARLRSRVAELEHDNEALRARVIIEQATLDEVTLDEVLALPPAPALA